MCRQDNIITTGGGKTIGKGGKPQEVAGMRGLKRTERGWSVEQQAVREPRAPAGSELPVLALDVVDGTGPGMSSI
jgi:hypothetical protein